jgi:CubicO group peptidase (beta-lactamase class C family)
VNRTETVAVVRLMAAAQREVDEGRTPACQLAVALHGELIAVRGFGAATATTRFAAMSCTKALNAQARRASALSDLATTCAQDLS